jgi:hypothetical protein
MARRKAKKKPERRLEAEDEKVFEWILAIDLLEHCSNRY